MKAKRWMPVVSSAHLWLDGEGELGEAAQSLRERLGGSVSPRHGSLRSAWLIGWIKETEEVADEEALTEALIEVSEAGLAEERKKRGLSQAIKSTRWSATELNLEEVFSEMMESAQSWDVVEAPCASWRPVKTAEAEDLRAWEEATERVAKAARAKLAAMAPIKGVKVEVVEKPRWIGEIGFERLNAKEWKRYAEEVRALAEAIELSEEAKAERREAPAVKSAPRM